MDGRANNGCKPGENRGQGRKAKGEEIKLIEQLTPLQDIAFEQLKKGVISGDFRYLKLYYEYLIGKPKQFIEMDGQLGLGTIPIDKWLDDNTSKETVS